VKRVPFIHRIATKILATLTVVSTLAVIATGAVLVTLSGRTLRSNISERNLQIARRASNEIGLYIENSISDIKAAAEILAALKDPWIQDILLENLASTFKRFQNIYLVSETGEVIASTRLDNRESGPNRSEALSQALSGQTYLSPVRLTAERLPYLTIGMPAGVPGLRRQVLIAELALRDIWDLVDDISFGRRGEALLISKDGLLIAHPDKTRVMKEAAEISSPCMGEPGSPEGSVSVYRRDGGNGMLVACAPVNGLDWYVVIQQPLAEAFLPMQAVLLQSAGLLFAMLAVAVFTSFILARVFSVPLNILLAGTYRIGRGDLDHRIDLRRKDEIGRLSSAFDRMVEDLREWSLKLRESEERYRLMAESVQDVIFSIDTDGRLLFANKRAEAVSGYSLGELAGRKCIEFLSEKSRETVRGMFGEALPRNLQQGIELEVELLARDGVRRVLEVKLVQVFNSAKRLQFYGVARDITQRKEAERKLLEYQQQLRSLASQLSLTEARERKRIAADLHDRIGQALALTQIKLGTLKAGIGSAKQIRSIDETIGLIEVTIREVRTLIFNLSSPLLYEVGLRAALEQLVEQFQDEHGILISLEDDELPKPIDIDRSIVLFQAVRELMLNVVKHARARHIRVSMHGRNNSIEITVQDDGAGFDVSRNAFRPGRQGGYGLFSIRERLEYLGGSLSVRSVPGQGTKAALALRLNKDTIKPGS
jgi:PAS domain S-box-containing protein